MGESKYFGKAKTKFLLDFKSTMLGLRNIIYSSWQHQASVFGIWLSLARELVSRADGRQKTGLGKSLASDA